FVLALLVVIPEGDLRLPLPLLLLLPFLLSSPQGICFLRAPGAPPLTTGCPTLDATSSRQGGGIARGSARGSCFCRCLCHPRRRSAVAVAFAVAVALLVVI